MGLVNSVAGNGPETTVDAFVSFFRTIADLVTFRPRGRSLIGGSHPSSDQPWTLPSAVPTRTTAANMATFYDNDRLVEMDLRRPNTASVQRRVSWWRQ